MLGFSSAGLIFRQIRSPETRGRGSYYNPVFREIPLNWWRFTCPSSRIRPQVRQMSASPRFRRLTVQGIGRSLDLGEFSAPIQRLGSGAPVLDSSLFVEYKSALGYCRAAFSEET